MNLRRAGTLSAIAVALMAAGCSNSRDLPDSGASNPGSSGSAVSSVASVGSGTAPETSPTVLPTTTSSTTTTTTIPATTTTTIPIVTEGAVVLVANATNVQGGAGNLTRQLAALGFQTVDATNAAGSEEFLDATKVYFLPGAEAVAESLGRILGGVTVTRMPTPAPITAATAGLGEATILVMLGGDIAVNGLPPLPG